MKETNRLFIIVLILILSSNKSLFSQDEFIPRKNQLGKYGYIDKSESFIISPKYDKAFSFRANLAKVIVKGKWGLINNSGDFIVKPKLDYIGWSNDGYFQWNKGNLSLTNNLIPPKNTFYPNSNGVFAYLSEGKWGLISSSGRLIKNEWDSIFYGDGGHFAVYEEGAGWSWIDENNKSNDEQYFQIVLPLSNGLIASMNQGDAGYKIYNFDGVSMSDSVYKQVRSLNSEFIKARNDFLWFQLDKNTKNINPESFEEIKYVQGNNTMQYLPYSPWVKSTIDFEEKENLNFLINYEVLDGFFVLTKNDINYLWNSSLDKKLSLKSGDTVISKPPFLAIQNNNDKSYQLIDEDLQKLATAVQSFKIIDSTNLLALNFSSNDWSIWDLSNNSNIVSHIGSEITMISENEYKLQKDNKFGLYDIKLKKWILNPEFKDVFRINDTLVAALSIDSLKFFGENIFLSSFDSYEDLKTVNDSVIALKSKGSKWSLRNVKLEKILKEEFTDIALTKEHSLRLKKEDFWMLYNLMLEKYILRNTYDSISDNQNGFFVVYKNEKIGIIDQRGNFTFQMSDYYNRIFHFYEKRWQVYRNGLSGIVDQNGILKISTQYEDFEKPVFGYIPFKFRGKWGLLDLKERFVLQPLNDRQDIISENFVQVWKNEQTGIKNINDKTLIPVEFESISRNEFGSFIVCKGQKKGFYSSEAQQIRPLSYDEIKQLSSDLIALKKNGYWQVINIKGNLVSDQKFRDIFFDPMSKQLFYKETKNWVIKSLD